MKKVSIGELMAVVDDKGNAGNMDDLREYLASYGRYYFEAFETKNRALAEAFLIPLTKAEPNIHFQVISEKGAFYICYPR